MTWSTFTLLCIHPYYPFLRWELHTHWIVTLHLPLLPALLCFLRCSKFPSHFATWGYPGRDHQFIWPGASSWSLLFLSVYCFIKSFLCMYHMLGTVAGCRNIGVRRLTTDRAPLLWIEARTTFKLHCSSGSFIRIPPHGWSWWTLHTHIVELLRLTVQGLYSCSFCLWGTLAEEQMALLMLISRLSDLVHSECWPMGYSSLLHWECVYVFSLLYPLLLPFFYVLIWPFPRLSLV